MTHAQESIDRFFASRPQAQSLYEAFADRVLSAYPLVQIVVQKTQITFRNRYVFACVSLPRKAKERAEAAIVVSFGLPARADSSRIALAVEAYPNRWTHHVHVRRADEIDAELMGFITAAYAFSESK